MEPAASRLELSNRLFALQEVVGPIPEEVVQIFTKLAEDPAVRKLLFGELTRITP